MWSPSSHRRIEGRPRGVAPTAIIICWLALSIALLAAAAPPARADFAAGAAAYDKGDYAAALAEWTAMANAGDARSQHGLGVLYESGRGLPAPDLPQAVAWYRAAAAHPADCFVLALK